MYGLYKIKHKIPRLQLSLEVLTVQAAVLTVQVPAKTAQLAKDFFNKILSTQNRI